MIQNLKSWMMVAFLSGLNAYSKGWNSETYHQRSAFLAHMAHLKPSIDLEESVTFFYRELRLHEEGLLEKKGQTLTYRVIPYFTQTCSKEWVFSGMIKKKDNGKSYLMVHSKKKVIDRPFYLYVTLITNDGFIYALQEKEKKSEKHQKKKEKLSKVKKRRYLSEQIKGSL